MKGKEIEFIDPLSIQIDNNLVRLFPAEFLYRLNFIPLREFNGILEIAMANPDDILARDEIELYIKKRIKIYASSPSLINEALRRSEISENILKDATEGYSIQLLETREEEGDEVISVEKILEGDKSIVNLVNTIIFTAVQKRASDIHIESKEREVTVKYRIDGVLYQAMDSIDKKFQSSIISRIKVMSDLDISEKRVPQDGRFRLKIKNKTIDFRVSIMPSIWGEDAVIRILDREMITEAVTELKLNHLGFTEELLRKFRKYITQPYGMILVTGPTGSGKTTTLYAVLHEIKSPEEKIVTIEDPVEYQIHGITQIPVNEKKGLTFARGLRSILRHDPDKIMVGEIRDPETAQIAIQSALTGHLVFTTVHANNVFDVIGRFIHMGVDPYSFVSSLNCILAQRLVRVLCQRCKIPKKYTEEELKESGLTPSIYKEHTFYEPKGCPSCNYTGYKGRTAIGEILELSDRIREIILTRKPTSEIKKVAKEEGMVSMREYGIEKVLKGITSLRELNRVTFVE